MRFLGIDYGTQRIGLAITDENHRLAFPKEVISNDRNALPKIGEILKKENIGHVVIGESLDFSGRPNPVSGKIEAFSSQLQKRFPVKIHKQKEFLTSVEARKVEETKASSHKSQAHSKVKKEKSEKADARAATLILQRFLDRYNK